MTITASNVKEYTRVVRVWFGCDTCDLKGDASMDIGYPVNDFVALLDHEHACRRQSVSQ